MHMMRHNKIGRASYRRFPRKHYQPVVFRWEGKAREARTEDGAESRRQETDGKRCDHTQRDGHRAADQPTPGKRWAKTFGFSDSPRLMRGARWPILAKKTKCHRKCQVEKSESWAKPGSTGHNEESHKLDGVVRG